MLRSIHCPLVGLGDDIEVVLRSIHCPLVRLRCQLECQVDCGHSGGPFLELRRVGAFVGVAGQGECFSCLLDLGWRGMASDAEMRPGVVNER